MDIVNISDRMDLLPLVVSWHEAEWGKEWGEQVAHSISRDQIPTIYVAIVPEVGAVGTAMLVDSDMTTRLDLSPWMGGVYVLPEYRNKGIATKLVLRVMEQARKLQIHRLWLYTAHSEALYRNLGWKFHSYEEYDGDRVSMMTYEW